jgi:hypothetical protein
MQYVRTLAGLVSFLKWDEKEGAEVTLSARKPAGPRFSCERAPVISFRRRPPPGQELNHTTYIIARRRVRSPVSPAKQWASPHPSPVSSLSPLIDQAGLRRSGHEPVQADDGVLEERREVCVIPNGRDRAMPTVALRRVKTVHGSGVCSVTQGSVIMPCHPYHPIRRYVSANSLRPSPEVGNDCGPPPKGTTRGCAGRMDDKGGKTWKRRVTALAAGTSGQSNRPCVSRVSLFVPHRYPGLAAHWTRPGASNPPRLSLISREASLVWHARPSCLLREIKPSDHRNLEEGVDWPAPRSSALLEGDSTGTCSVLFSLPLVSHSTSLPAPCWLVIFYFLSFQPQSALRPSHTSKSSCVRSPPRGAP